MVDEHIHIHSEYRYGNTFSTLSLSIEDTTQKCGGHCIGYVRTNLGELLDACAGKECMYDGDYMMIFISQMSDSYCSQNNVRSCWGTGRDYWDDYCQAA
jgi:hypothetical protein